MRAKKARLFQGKDEAFLVLRRCEPTEEKRQPKAISVWRAFSISQFRRLGEGLSGISIFEGEGIRGLSPGLDKTV